MIFSLCVAEMHLAVDSGSWADGNDNGRPDASEAVAFGFTVTNEGTVTLEFRSGHDTFSSGCTLSEALRLKQGEQHECTAFREVRGSPALRCGMPCELLSRQGTCYSFFFFILSLTPSAM